MVLAPLPKPARRITGVRTACRDVPGHHRTRPDHDIVDDPNGHDRGVRPDRNPIANHGFTPQFLAPARRAAGRKRVIDEHHAMTDKAVIADRHQLADEGMRLHARARANARALLNFRKGPDKTIVVYFAAVQIAGLDDANPRAK